MVRPFRRHRFPFSNGPNATLLYAVKPLHDKAFNLSWLQGAFCYTWHTLRSAEGEIREKKGLR
jgi:hypothetical protein